MLSNWETCLESSSSIQYLFNLVSHWNRLVCFLCHIYLFLTNSCACKTTLRQTAACVCVSVCMLHDFYAVFLTSLISFLLFSEIHGIFPLIPFFSPTDFPLPYRLLSTYKHHRLNWLCEPSNNSSFVVSVCLEIESPTENPCETKMHTHTHTHSIKNRNYHREWIMGYSRKMRAKEIERKIQAAGTSNTCL